MDASGSPKTRTSEFSKIPLSNMNLLPEGLMTFPKKASPNTRFVFEIGPPAWIKKEINNNAIENYLALPKAFYDAIGLREPWTIMLKTSMSSTSSWGVCCPIQE
ncbi:unnamed protein product [Urochloa humidicola]